MTTPPISLVPRSQDAELVTLGVGQHDPAHVALPDVDPLRAARLKPLDLGLVDVKVAAVDEDWSGLRLVWRARNRG